MKFEEPLKRKKKTVKPAATPKRLSCLTARSKEDVVVKNINPETLFRSHNKAELTPVLSGAKRGIDYLGGSKR
jgi:hypothetical protein